MEILAPAGGYDQIIAAVRCGADAVYVGLNDFNARKGAKNFDIDGLLSAVKYCHARDVLVYLTLNTLIKDSELVRFYDLIKAALNCGIDAVIVQDLGAARILRKICPALRLHGSTQMSVHNLNGVLELESLGFKRVVLARELSFDEICYITQNCSIETEVFVHGALCMCISGGCYLSSILGQRSANRGMCAQPCRLNFKSGSKEYALSLKDLSVIEYLGQLKKAGVKSAKIEGRMKRPEYVAAAVSACRNKLDGKGVNLNTLKAVFSRSGFTDGYYTAKRNTDMFGFRTKEDVTAAKQVLAPLHASYSKEVGKIFVDMQITLKQGTPANLYVTDGKNSAIATGALPEPAITRPLNTEIINYALSKCGGTPFIARKISCDIEDNISLPMSALNSLRKEALSKLLIKRAQIKPYKINDFSLQIEPVSQPLNKKLIARFNSIDQLPKSIAADYIALDASTILQNKYLIEMYRPRLIAELCAYDFEITPQKAAMLIDQLKKEGITCVMAENLWAINAAKNKGLKIIAGSRLNITNSQAILNLYEQGVNAVLLSFELSLARINRLHSVLPYGILAYGRLPLMSFRNCPARLDKNCFSNKDGCKIYDRYGTAFDIICNKCKVSTLLNSVPLNVLDRLDEFYNISYAMLYFTNETKAQCLHVLECYQKGIKPEKGQTRGLYFREII